MNIQNGALGSMRSTLRHLFMPTLLVPTLFMGALGFSSCTPVEDSPDVVVTSDAGEEPFCPTRIRFTTLADAQTNVGSSGGAHNAQFPEGEVFLVDVLNCNDECENCRFAGPVEDLPVIHTRCLSDTSIICGEGVVCPQYDCRDTVVPTGLEPPAPPTAVVPLCSDTFTPCGENRTCPESACGYMLGATGPSAASPNDFGPVFLPSATSATNAPIEGTIDLVTGQVNFTTWNLFIATSNRDPANGGGYGEKCIGDVVRNDGIKDGTCQPGAIPQRSDRVSGRPCDINGASTFSVSAAGIDDAAGTYSLDCSTPLAIAFSLASENFDSTAAAVWRLEEGEQPEDEDGNLFWCGRCSDSKLACHANDDCDSNDCEAVIPPEDLPTGASIRNNICFDQCAWSNETLSGTCTGFFGFDADTGAPILRPNWPCFPDQGDIEDTSIRVRGGTFPLNDRSFSIQVSDLSCVDQTLSAPTNDALGLPAATLSKIRFRVDLE